MNSPGWLAITSKPSSSRRRRKPERRIEFVQVPVLPVIMAIRDFPPWTSTSAMRDAPRSESVATQIAALSSTRRFKKITGTWLSMQRLITAARPRAR